MARLGKKHAEEAGKDIKFYALSKGLAFYVQKFDGNGKRVKKTDSEGNNAINDNYLFEFRQILDAEVNSKVKRQFAQESVFWVEQEMKRINAPDENMDNPESYESLKERIIAEIYKLKNTPLLRVLTEDEYMRYKHPDTYQIKKEMEEKDKLLSDRQKRIEELEAMQNKGV